MLAFMTLHCRRGEYILLTLASHAGYSMVLIARSLFSSQTPSTRSLLALRPWTPTRGTCIVSANFVKDGLWYVCMTRGFSTVTDYATLECIRRRLPTSSHVLAHSMAEGQTMSVFRRLRMPPPHCSMRSKGCWSHMLDPPNMGTPRGLSLCRSSALVWNTEYELDSICISYLFDKWGR